MDIFTESPNPLKGQKESFLYRVMSPPDRVSDAEVLQYLMGFVASKRSSRDIAKALSIKFGSFGNIISADPRELTEVPGLGIAGAAILKLIRVAATRLLESEISDRNLLNSWDRLIDYLRADLSREQTETIRGLFLDGKYRLITAETLVTGSLRNAILQPRELIKRSIELNAIHLVIAHNHPSGDPKASLEDIKTTMFLRYSLSLVEVCLFDHIIVGNGKYMSFRKEGWFERDVIHKARPPLGADQALGAIKIPAFEAFS